MKLTEQQIKDIQRIKESVFNSVRNYEQMVDVGSWDSPKLIKIIDDLILQAKIHRIWEVDTKTLMPTCDLLGTEEEEDEQMFGRTYLQNGEKK